MPNSMVYKFLYRKAENFREGAIESMPVLTVTRVKSYYRTTVSREARKILGLNSKNPVKRVLKGEMIVRKKH